MEKRKVLYESAIFTGSEMNHRTFGDDESWNSLQSTILAGHVLTDDSSVFSEENLDELTTVNEENSMLLKEVMRDDSFKSAIDENILNINLDALSEDDAFVDSPALYSRQPFRSTSRIDIPSSPNDIQVSSTQVSANEYLHIFDFDSLSNNLTEKEKTGALLLQAIDDYNDIKYHAQSTPIKDSSKSKCTASPIGISLESLKNPSNNAKGRNCANTSNVSTVSAMKINSASNDNYLPDDPANKENFYQGKYSSAVNKVPKKKEIPSKIPVMRSRPPKVALMKEFFENCCKISEYRNLKSSRNSPTLHKIMSERSCNNIKLKKLLLTHNRNSQSLSRDHQKGKTTPALKKTIIKSTSAKSTKSPYYRNHESKSSKNRSARSSSCSEFSKDSLFNTQSYKDSLDSKSSRSKSTSDLPHTSNSTTAKWSNTYEIKKTLKSAYLLVNQRSTIHPKSPKKTPKKQTKASYIMSRRSLEFVRSPVKPVKELRKLFSPSVRAMENQINKGNLPKVSKKPKVPRVIVDGDLKL